MDASRPTREFTTSGGYQLVLNEYITGAEHRRIRAHYGTSLKKSDAERDDTQVDFEGDNLAFELVIVSINGNSNNLVETVLALPLPDFKEIVSEVKDTVEGKKK